MFTYDKLDHHATFLVYDPSAMDHSTRSSIASWLRRLAECLEANTLTKKVWADRYMMDYPYTII